MYHFVVFRGKQTHMNLTCLLLAFPYRIGIAGIVYFVFSITGLSVGVRVGRMLTSVTFIRFVRYVWRSKGYEKRGLN